MRIKYLNVKLINIEKEPFEFTEELAILKMWDKLRQIISNTDIKGRLELHDENDTGQFASIEFAATDEIDTSKILEIRQRVYKTVNMLICTGSIMSDQWYVSEKEHDIEDNTDVEWTFGVIELESVTQ